MVLAELVWDLWALWDWLWLADLKLPTLPINIQRHGCQCRQKRKGHKYPTGILYQRVCLVMSETSTTSPTLSRPDSRRGNVASFVEGSVPVEELVEHLLAARRSLSKMGLVLEANSLTTTARLAHEESVILEAQTDFLRRGIDDEVRVLLRVRKGMMRAYDAGKREFKQILRTLDAANGRLEQTMEMLRQTMVESAFRPPDEKPRSLLHFVDEKNIDGMRELLKESIAGLQVRPD